MKYINSYSFIFSPRPGTPAAKMKQMNYEISKERLIIFQKAAEKIKLDYRKKLISHSTQVLLENKVVDKEEFFGRDEFSNSVIVKSQESVVGQIKEVKIINGNQNTLFGEIKKNNYKKECAA